MLLHTDKIKDTDHHFEIDAITRSIKNVSGSKTTVIQHDHNSERFTFEIPRYIEGHDMMECNLVEVHYINESTKGRYIVNDLTVIEDDENRLKFTWLLTNNASSNVGVLMFSVRFACLQGNEAVYVWNTAPYKGITVSTGIYNNEEIAEQNPDIIDQLLAKIDAIISGGGSGGSVDLLNYFTKDEVTQVIDFQIQNVYGVIDSEIKIIDKEKEDVLNKVSVIDGLSPDKDKEYPTVWAVWKAVTDCEDTAISYTDNAIGGIETALENIIAKYGLGGDAT